MFIYEIHFALLLKWILKSAAQHSTAQQSMVQSKENGMSLFFATNNSCALFALDKISSSSFTCQQHQQPLRCRYVDIYASASETKTTKELPFSFQFMWIFTHRVKENRYRTHVYFMISLSVYVPMQQQWWQKLENTFLVCLVLTHKSQIVCSFHLYSFNSNLYIFESFFFVFRLHYVHFICFPWIFFYFVQLRWIEKEPVRGGLRIEKKNSKKRIKSI